jgi:hypothetical protein
MTPAARSERSPSRCELTVGTPPRRSESLAIRRLLVLVPLVTPRATVDLGATHSWVHRPHRLASEASVAAGRAESDS